MEKTRTISQKEKELVYVGASIAAGCKPCTDYHVKSALQAGADTDEVKQAISYATCVAKSALGIMEQHGLKRIGAQTEAAGDCCPGDTTRLKELVSIAASYAVNCTENLRKHIKAGRAVGIKDAEIKEILEAARFVKCKADSHVKKIAERFSCDFDSEPDDISDSSACGADDATSACGTASKMESKCGEMMQKFKSMMSDDDCQKIFKACVDEDEQEKKNDNETGCGCS